MHFVLICIIEIRLIVKQVLFFSATVIVHSLNDAVSASSIVTASSGRGESAAGNSRGGVVVIML